MAVFKKIQPEELLLLLDNFKTVIDRTGTTTWSGWNNYLHKLLHRDELWEFDTLTSQNTGKSNLQIQ